MKIRIRGRANEHNTYYIVLENDSVRVFHAQGAAVDLASIAKNKLDVMAVRFAFEDATRDIGRALNVVRDHTVLTEVELLR